MLLRDFFSGISKAQLQACYVYWFPGKEVLSVRERLMGELLEVMTDQGRVRQRFDGLSKSQQGFVVSLLVQPHFSATVDAVRANKYGRVIADFEVEGVLKSLQEAGYIVRTAGTGGYANEVFTIPEELGNAVLRTVPVEERSPRDLLSLAAHLASSANGAGDQERTNLQLGQRIESLEDPELRTLAALAIAEHGGILVHSTLAAPKGEPGPPAALRLGRPDWKGELERLRVGTTGILSLKDYGIDVEEDGLFIFQELVHEAALEEAVRGKVECDREICAGADLLIDLERSLELLRTESLDVTREGNVYKKIEERIAGQFVTARYPELHEGSPVGHVIELGKRLQLVDEAQQKVVFDPLRRWVWRKKPLDDKISQVFEIYLSERRGHRWSFHQTQIRRIFLDLLKATHPGHWLVARPFLTATLSHYLANLDALDVRKAYTERCTGDFKNETLVVPLQKLNHDLSYWVVHRLGLLGVVDLGYQSGSFQALRLSRVGRKLLGVEAPAEVVEPATRQLLVNPDFEILIFPEADEVLSWKTSLFADRIDSDRMKRYRLNRESLKRGVVAGLTPDEIVSFLGENARGALPPNVLYSVKEWTDGVELVRLQKVQLLRCATPRGADKLASLLEAKNVSCERLNETTIMVRGTKHEKALSTLQELLRDHGLYVE